MHFTRLARASLALAMLSGPMTAQSEPMARTSEVIVRIESLPRLRCFSDAPACKINTMLFAMDQKIFETVKDCRTIPPEKVTASAPDTPTERIFWDRRVRVTMNGPAFLSNLVADDAYCPGAAHGFSTLTPLLFDLTAGAALDPEAWLPRYLTTGANAALTELYLANLAPTSPRISSPFECPDVLRSNPHGFLIWPDAAALSLVLQPAGLAYVFSGCAEPTQNPARHLARAPLRARVAAGAFPAMGIGWQAGAAKTRARPVASAVLHSFHTAGFRRASSDRLRCFAALT